MKQLSLVVVSMIALVSMAELLPAKDAIAPISIGDRACLFLDDRFVAEHSGFKRTWHQGQPRPEVAIKDQSSSWERWPHMFGSTVYDPQAKVYRMYYESAIYPSRTPPNSFTTYVCYAESPDGKTWTKPKLGLFEDLGSKDNNIVIHCGELAKVFLDPLETDLTKRWKMFVYLNGKPPSMGGSGECLLASGDGIHWKFLGGFNKPEYARADQGNYTDTYSFLFDPLQQRYMAFIRTFDRNSLSELKDGRRRAIGISHSAQVNQGWSPTVQVLAPDADDDAKVAALGREATKPDWAEHYCMPLFVYGNHYLGMLSLLYFVDGTDSLGGGDIQLTYSHNGERWFRQPQRQTLIAPSLSAPELFPTYVSINGPVEIDNELWLYYTEANGAHPVAPFEKSVSQIRAAVWRKDGFVSLDATEAANLTTQPLAWDGKQLRVNLKCLEGGRLRVAVLNAEGHLFPGLDLADCDPLTGDQTQGVVHWKGRADLSELKGKPVRLKCELTRGSLYSFRASAD